MKFTNLQGLPVEVTAVTLHKYGNDEGVPGASISFKATVKEDTLEFNNGSGNLSLWSEDDTVTDLAKIMNGSPLEFEDLEMDLRIATSNGAALLDITGVHKLTVKDVKPKADRMLECKFSASWRNGADDVYAAQMCMKCKDLTLTTG